MEAPREPADPGRRVEPTPRTRLRRRAERGRYEREVIDGILDDGFVGHLGFAIGGRPWVLPMAYGRIEDAVFLHGAAANHALGALTRGIEACFTVTLVDGFVLARSAFHHSLNYRSVTLFGVASRVDDLKRKRSAVTGIVDHVVPGRADDVRPPTDSELRGTVVLELPISEASAKVRTGGPVDEPDDLGLPIWAGEIPLLVTTGAPIPDGTRTITPPAYVTNYQRVRPVRPD